MVCKTKKQAEAAANKVLKKLTTAGWKIIVWKYTKATWLWRLQNNYMSVWQKGDLLPVSSESKKYVAEMMDQLNTPGCLSQWRNDSEWDDPNKAISARLIFAKQKLSAMRSEYLRLSTIYTQQLGLLLKDKKSNYNRYFAALLKKP